MATEVSLTVSMYDYNGSLCAFGVVSGLGGVNSVRMYLSTGTRTAYQYYSTQIYNKSEAKINTKQYPTPSFVFNVRTDRDTEDASIYPKQLKYGQYKFSFHFYDKNGTLLNTTPLTLTDGSDFVYYQMHNSLTSPAITWDESNKMIRLLNRGKYRYMIEIRRKDRNLVNTNFKPEVKDYAYEVVMKNPERGKYWEAIPNTALYGEPGREDTGDRCRYRNRWVTNRIQQRVLIIYDSGAKFTESDKTDYDTIVTKALGQLTDMTGINFTIVSRENTDGTPAVDYDPYDCDKTMEAYVDAYGYDREEPSEAPYDIIVRVGNDTTMDSKKGDWVGEGMWRVWRWDVNEQDGIATSIACINVDKAMEFESIRHVFFEEIYQSFGMGADNYSNPLSIHWDPEYTNPDSYYIKDWYNGNIQWDKEVMRFWQSQNMNGWSNIDLINNMDTPCCMFKEWSGKAYYDFDLSGLTAGDYIVYGWVAGEKTRPAQSGTSEHTVIHGWDDSPYSNKACVEITIPNTGRPNHFSWTYPKEKGELFNLTADEWNALTKNINEVREYKGLSAYSFTMAVKGEVFKASMYMEAREAILEIQGYGTYIPSVAAKDTITAAAMNSVVSELNAVP